MRKISFIFCEICDSPFFCDDVEGEGEAIFEVFREIEIAAEVVPAEEVSNLRDEYCTWSRRAK